MNRHRLRPILPAIVLVIGLAVVLPQAAAHGAPEATAAFSEGRVLVAREASAQPPPGDRVVGDAPVLRAWHDHGGLFVEARVPDDGWILLAVEQGNRQTVPMQGMTMDVALYHGALVTGGGAPEAAAVRFSRIVGATGHAHDETELAGLLETSARPGLEVDAEAEEGGETTRVRVRVPADAFGARALEGEIRNVVIAWSQHPTPPTFFVGERPHEAREHTLYFPTPGDSEMLLGAVAQAYDGRPLWHGVAWAAGLGAAMVGVVAIVAARGELTAAGTGRSRLLDALADALVVRQPRRSAARWVQAGVVLVMLTAPLVPGVEAQYVPGPLPPPASDPGDPCTEGAPVRHYNVSAVDADIVFNRFGDHDPQGSMYVITEKIPDLLDEADRMDDVLAGNQSAFPEGGNESLFVPLALRAHVGDCIEIDFTNQLMLDPPVVPHPPEPPEPVHEVIGGHVERSAPESVMPPERDRRASIHVHGLAVDPRGSGGGAVGNNPDTTVAIGETVTYRWSATHEGLFFFHDHGDPSTFGRNSIRGLDEDFRGNTAHGLFGAVAVEPDGSEWRHPSTGEPVTDGWKADIIVPGGESFREFVIFYHDPQVIGRDGGEVPEPMADHGLNYRVETMSRRIFDDEERCLGANFSSNGGENPCTSPALVYSSFVHGDPGTPITRSYVGDKVKMRIAHAGTEEAHVHHLHNHRWKAVGDKDDATFIDSQTISPGETWTQTINGAGGEAGTKGPGDSIFHCHLFPHLYGGMWGIFRTHDRLEPDLLPLPDVPPPPKEPGKPGFPGFMRSIDNGSGERPPRPPQEAGLDNRTGIVAPAPGAPYVDPCPPAAPMRRYHLVMMDVNHVYNDEGDHSRAQDLPESTGVMYALAEDEAALRAGTKAPEPLVMRARAGECVEVLLENHLPSFNNDSRIGLAGSRTGIHPHLHPFDVLGSDGLATGWNFDSSILPGENITYRYHADTELQTIVWHDHTAGLRGLVAGAYGASVIEHENASWRNPKTGGPIYTMGADASDGYFDSTFDAANDTWAHMWEADIHGPGIQSTREFFLSIQDFMPLRNADGIPYRPNVAFPAFDDFGYMGFNYRSEPLLHRTWAGMDRVFDSEVHGDPSTPLFEAYAGDPVVFRFHQVPFEEAHAVTLQGHRWRFGFMDPASRMVDTLAIGVSEAFNAYLDGGAGGPLAIPGDYLYRSAPVDDTFAGAWGIFRVHGEQVEGLKPLPDSPAPPVVAPEGPVDPCPPSAPRKYYDVHAIQKELVYNGHGDHDMRGMMFVMGHHVEEVRRGLSRDPLDRPEYLVHPEPMTLRVHEGDCVKIKLTNSLPEETTATYHAMPQPTGGSRAFNVTAENMTELLATPSDALPHMSSRTGMFTHLLLHDVRDSGGVKVGRNPDSTTGPGDSKTYTYYADTSRIGMAFVEDMADPLHHTMHGLFGGIVVLPKGAKVVSPVDGHRESHDAIVDVVMPDGTAWRDAALYFQAGLALTSPDGHPVPQREHETPDNVDAEEAVERVLFEVEQMLGNGTAERATIQKVSHAGRGWSIRLTVDGWHLHGVVDSVDGRLRDLDAVQDPRWLEPGGLVQLTDSRGRPVVDLGVRVEIGDKTFGEAVTDASGVAHFPAPLPRAAVMKVRVDADDVDFLVRTDSEGRFRASVRAYPESLAEIERAADAAFEFLGDAGLPAGGLGVTAIDVGSNVWRVTAADALRTYRVEMNALDGSLMALAFDSHASTLAAPSYLDDGQLEQAAASFLRHHFGAADGPVQIESFRDRMGVWRVEIDAGGWANTIRLDTASTRVLHFLRVPSDGAPLTLLAQVEDATLRFRREDGAPLMGTLVSFHRDGLLVGQETMNEQGRTRVNAELLEDVERPTALVVGVPRLDLQFPWDVVPEAQAYTELDGLASSAAIPASTAIQIAQEWLRAHEVDEEDDDGGMLPRGLAHLRRMADGWHVGFGNDVHLVDVVVDPATGEVVRLSMRTDVPLEDMCSSELVEHYGPHSPPACPWSFTVVDEEDQGLKGINYRSEPFQWRIYRYSDPAYVYSSSVHGDPVTPIVNAYPGDPVRLHVVGAVLKPRLQAFVMDGHVWHQQPGDAASPFRSAEGGLAHGRVFQLDLVGGAGGVAQKPGDYLFQGAIQRHATETGAWGLLRVHDARVDGLRMLSDWIPSASGGGIDHEDTPTSGPGGPSLAQPCGSDVMATLVRHLVRDADGRWMLRPDPDGWLQTPFDGRTDLLLRVEFAQAADVVRDVRVRADAGAEWLVTVTPVAPLGGERAFCITLAGPTAAETPLTLRLDFAFFGAKTQRVAAFSAEMPFAPSSPPPPASPTSGSPTPEGGAFVPGTGPVTTFLVVAAAALVVARVRRWRA